MITYHNGDLLKSGCNIICHQVNLQGVMGGGLALQIAKKYPECEKEYAEFVKKMGSKHIIGGTVYFYHIDDEHMIANCFTQDEFFNTDYVDLMCALGGIYAKVKPGQTVGFPYGYGCGIAKGNWEQVESLIIDTFKNSDIDCQIWKCEEGKK